MQFKNLKKKSGNVFNYCAPRFHKPNIKIKNFAEMGHPRPVPHTEISPSQNFVDRVSPLGGASGIIIEWYYYWWFQVVIDEINEQVLPTNKKKFTLKTGGSFGVPYQRG